MLRSNLREDSVGAVLSAGIDGADGDLLVVNPSVDAIDALVEVLQATESPPTVRLFAAEQPLKDLMDDFLIASAVADLRDRGVLAVRTLSSVPNNALLLSEESVVAVVESDGSAAGLVTTDSGFVDSTYDHYADRWETAEEFSLRTPPRSEVMETLESEIGPDTAEDFAAVLDSLETARGGGDGLDEVTISLLVAARNGQLLYDISKWGEDIGLASKATFSRTKTRLEDHGLVDTEKVPIDVGRPRLRLMPGSDRLETAAIEDLGDVAAEMLS
jgi:hypothetical protein